MLLLWYSKFSKLTCSDLSSAFDVASSFGSRSYEFEPGLGIGGIVVSIM